MRRHLKFLSYAPVVFVSATTGKNLDKLFSTLELVARERRKRIGTGEMNRFLSHVDFERASVPIAKRVKIFYMTQAAVSPPTFILFTDRAGEAALLVRAISGKPDSRGVWLHRHAYLDQEPGTQRAQGKEIEHIRSLANAASGGCNAYTTTCAGSSIELGPARTNLGNSAGRWKSKPTVAGNRRFAASTAPPPAQPGNDDLAQMRVDLDVWKASI